MPRYRARRELAILTVLFLLGGGLFWRYEHANTQPPTATLAVAPVEPPMPSAMADTRPSIAVLPFQNRSAKQDDAFFVDGIHDDILMQLSKVRALKVISRTSVEQFRDTKLPTKVIAQQLGVKSLLEGGVQRAGDRVRITVQLIDAADEAHLWAESYDRELTVANIFAIQSEVAAAIAFRNEGHADGRREGERQRTADAEPRSVGGLPVASSAWKRTSKSLPEARGILPEGD